MEATMRPQANNIVFRFWRWTKGQMISQVPEAIALCEFDCGKRQCQQTEWASCERRLAKAKGELSRSACPRAGAGVTRLDGVERV
jgi:hypothetical protein